MAYIVTNKDANQNREVTALKNYLVNALNTSGNIYRQIINMTDEQVESEFGVPLAMVTPFRATITAMKNKVDNDEDFQAYISQIG